jgi:pimeloyl-ACP methyl ester carboxylesterase
MLAWREVGSGAVLVCHPGGPGFSAAYFGDLRELAARETLVLLDPRGTGASDRPSDASAYALEDYAADVEALREQLGADRLDLLGHSHGGFAAITWAGTHPERVGRLVLASTTPRFTDSIRQTQRARVELHVDEPYFADAMAALELHHQGRYATDAELADLYRREALLFMPVGFDLEPMLRALEPAGTNADALHWFNERIAPTMDLRPLLARIDAPTLVISGDQDPFASSAAEMAEVLPNATLRIVDGADHFPFLEPDHRAAWSGAVLEFLEG